MDRERIVNGAHNSDGGQSVVAHTLGSRGEAREAGPADITWRGRTVSHSRFDVLADCSGAGTRIMGAEAMN